MHHATAVRGLSGSPASRKVCAHNCPNEVWWFLELVPEQNTRVRPQVASNALQRLLVALARGRHPTGHPNWMSMRSTARTLHLVAMKWNCRASCGSSSVSCSKFSHVLPTTSLPFALLHPHLLQDQFNIPWVSFDAHTVFLPLGDPAQHHKRLVVRHLSCPTLALYFS